jgi:hypothetical protein
MPSADELHMQQRKIEKDTATDEIAVTLNRLMGEQREPDPWERVCLVRALSEVFSGCYSLAMTDARLALTPPDQQTPFTSLAVDPFFDRCDLQLLSRALRAAVVEPVRPFPHLGPVELTDGDTLANP